MSSETTRKQIEWVDTELGNGCAGITENRMAEWDMFCRSKLALVQCLEIQERMERGEGKAPSTDGGYDQAARYFGLPGYRPGEDKGALISPCDTCSVWRVAGEGVYNSAAECRDDFPCEEYKGWSEGGGE